MASWRNWLTGWGRPVALPPIPPRALTAAAEAVSLDDRAQLRRLDVQRSADLPWQFQALADPDRCGTVGYASGFVEIMLGRFEYKAGWLNDNGEPEPLDSGPLAEALAALESREQSRSALFGRMGGLWFLTGEAWLVGSKRGRSVDWEVLSVAELRSEIQRLVRVRFPGAMPEPLPSTSVPIRTWWPNLTYYAMARSPHKAGMRDVARLVVLEDSVQSIARSRLVTRGAFIYPSEVNDMRRPLTNADGQTVDQPTFGADFIKIAQKAIEDPSSVAAQVPIPLGVPSKDGNADVSRFIDFASKQDARILELLQDARRDYGNTVWLPVDELMGKGDLNHWNYWGVTADTARHLVPIAEAMADSVARQFLRPVAIAAKLDPTRVVIIADASPIVLSPDRSESATEGYKLRLLSEEVWRRENHYEEADAPDEAERERRLREDALLSGQDPNAVEAVEHGEEVPVADETGTPGTMPAEPIPEPAAALVAAAGPRHLTRLSRTLARIEARTRERLQADCEHALADALHRAGNRVMSSRPAQQGNMRARLANVARSDVCALIGPSGMRELGLTEDELLRDASSALQARTTKTLTAAQREALRAAAAEGDESEEWVDEQLAKGGHDMEAAALLLAGFLLALASKRLFDPHPAAPEQGELSGSVPASLVGFAMARAGGGPTPNVGSDGLPLPVGPDSGPVLGLTAGPNMQGAVGELFTDAEYGWTWSWGGSARPFPPHEDIDGTTVTDFDDPVLAVPPGYGWLGVDRLAPLDHVGCRCEWTLSISVGVPEAVAASANGRTVPL